MARAPRRQKRTQRHERRVAAAGSRFEVGTAKGGIYWYGWYSVLGVDLLGKYKGVVI